MTTLSTEEINSFIESNSGWNYIDNSIQKKFEFPSQSTAFQFVIKVAQISEVMQHHPEWSGVQKNVFIKLYSHDTNSISKRDIELALKIEEFAK